MSTESPAGADAGPSPLRERWNRLFQGLQKMGRSLQLPIAVLPAAGILNRLGQPDVFGDDGLGWTNVSKVMAGAGGALLDGSLGLPLLFCVGVAIGMAKKADGSTALAAVAGFLVYFNVLRQFPKDCPEGSQAVPNVGCQLSDGTVTAFDFQNPGVFGGIVIRSHGGVLLAAVPPDEAGGLAGLLQRAAPGADHHGVRGDRVRGGVSVDLAADR